MGGRMFVPKSAQHDPHPTNQAVDPQPTNQAVAKFGTVPGAQ